MTIQNPGDFPDPQEHQPERVIQIGEWLRPFADLQVSPTEKELETTFKVTGIGKCSVSLVEGDYAGTGNIFLVTLPWGSTLVKGEDTADMEQDKMETGLMSFVAMADDVWANKEFPYKLEVMLPDETKLDFKNASEGERYTEPAFTGGDLESTQEHFDLLLVPKVDRILGGIQLRFVPKEVSS